MVERFSYDLEMKKREQNRNNKRTEIELFYSFIERIETRGLQDSDKALILFFLLITDGNTNFFRSASYNS